MKHTVDNALSRQGLAPHYNIDDVMIDESLGEGAFGTVYRGWLPSQAQPFAIKCISKQSVARRKMQKQLALEIAVHRSLRHPNIVRFYDFANDGESVYYFLEYASNGDLFTYMQKFDPADEEVANILRQVGEAVAFCHSYGVVHRDLKPENILMTAHGVPKLTDFGYCDRVDAEGYCKDRSICGTASFMAPEVVREELYGYPVDCWSFGVVIFDTMAGESPFKGKNSEDTFRRIEHCIIDWRSHSIEACCRELLESIFIVDPDDRPTMTEILQHEWFHQNSNTR